MADSLSFTVVFFYFPGDTGYLGKASRNLFHGEFSLFVRDFYFTASSLLCECGLREAGRTCKDFGAE